MISPASKRLSRNARVSAAARSGASSGYSELRNAARPSAVCGEPKRDQSKEPVEFSIVAPPVAGLNSTTSDPAWLVSTPGAAV